MGEYDKFIDEVVKKAAGIKILSMGPSSYENSARDDLGVEAKTEESVPWIEIFEAWVGWDKIPVPPTARKFVDAIVAFAQALEPVEDLSDLTQEQREELEEKVSAIEKAAKGFGILEDIATPVCAGVRKELEQATNASESDSEGCCGEGKGCRCQSSSESTQIGCGQGTGCCID